MNIDLKTFSLDFCSSRYYVHIQFKYKLQMYWVQQWINICVCVCVMVSGGQVRFIDAKGRMRNTSSTTKQSFLHVFVT